MVSDSCMFIGITVVVYHAFTQMKVELFIIYDNICKNFPCTHSKNNPAILIVAVHKPERAVVGTCDGLNFV